MKTNHEFDDFETALIRQMADHFDRESTFFVFRECAAYEQDPQACEEAIKRFNRLNMVVTHDRQSVTILPLTLSVAQQVRKPPRPDYRKEISDWFWNHKWSVGVLAIVVGFPLAVEWVEGLLKILAWLSIVE